MSFQEKAYALVAAAPLVWRPGVNQPLEIVEDSTEFGWPEDDARTVVADQLVGIMEAFETVKNEYLDEGRAIFIDPESIAIACQVLSERGLHVNNESTYVLVNSAQKFNQDMRDAAGLAGEVAPIAGFREILTGLIVVGNDLDNSTLETRERFREFWHLLCHEKVHDREGGSGEIVIILDTEDTSPVYSFARAGVALYDTATDTPFNLLEEGSAAFYGATSSVACLQRSGYDPNVLPTTTLTRHRYPELRLPQNGSFMAKTSDKRLPAAQRLCDDNLFAAAAIDALRSASADFTAAHIAVLNNPTPENRQTLTVVTEELAPGAGLAINGPIEQASEFAVCVSRALFCS